MNRTYWKRTNNILLQRLYKIAVPFPLAAISRCKQDEVCFPSVEAYTNAQTFNAKHAPLCPTLVELAILCRSGFPH